MASDREEGEGIVGEGGSHRSSRRRENSCPRFHLPLQRRGDPDHLRPRGEDYPLTRERGDATCLVRMVCLPGELGRV
ncbi:hypothetical protein R1flu_010692 [Riccia fluitans]|uniref:Uncharacterized protein n=1 Tax=Riccia fluitans TaxID=41844 RepID=A0ABD1Z5W0_9MARC